MQDIGNRILRVINALIARVPEAHRRHIPAAALVAGFVLDFLTLGRPDQVYGNLVILTHFVLAGGSILLLNIRKSRGEEKMILPLTLLMQFSFGSLASALLLFYGQSGTLTGNWLFLTLFAGLLIGNELARSRYALILFHISFLYLLVFTYFALIVPILLDRMGTLVFLASGILSLAFIAAFMYILFAKAPQVIKVSMRPITAVILIIFIALNTLYFFNLIPPVPLALRSVDIYQNVVRVGESSYQVTYERDSRGAFPRNLLPFSPQVIHIVPGQSLYCLSSVFAPTGLSVPIRHRWERFSETRDAWQTEALISFPIRGGRTEGYRGFTIKRLGEGGMWRCDVETISGALIGRISFRAVESTTTPALVSEVK